MFDNDGNLSSKFKTMIQNWVKNITLSFNNKAFRDRLKEHNFVSDWFQ